MTVKHTIRGLLLLMFLASALVFCVSAASAQSGAALEQRIKKIVDRPEFAHSRFGIKFISADTGNVVYELNSQEFFVPGSTTKLLTEGTALELLGADYRFRTKIYRTGPVGKNGTLKGDLVLVSASGCHIFRILGLASPFYAGSCL